LGGPRSGADLEGLGVGGRGRKEGGPLGEGRGSGVKVRFEISDVRSQKSEVRSQKEEGGVGRRGVGSGAGGGKFSWYFFSFFVINRNFFVDLIERMGNDKSTDGWDGTDLH